MKQIPLTQNQFALVDDEDFEYLNQWKWYAHKRGSSFYARRKLTRRDGIYMHTALMNTPPGLVVDHVDFNGLNNQKNNLRIVTQKENNLHRKIKPAGSTPKGNKFQAQIRREGKSYYLGLFPTRELAFLAYETKRRELENIESLSVALRCER